MERITLYTLQSETVTQYCKDELLFAPFNGVQHITDYSKDGSDRFIERQFKTTRVPIERFINNNPNGTREEYLIAFDPDIRKLLHINENNLKLELKDVKDKLNGANKTNDILVKYKNDLLVEVEDLNDEVIDLKNNLNIFYLMPFWKRVLFLFVGEMLKGWELK